MQLRKYKFMFELVDAKLNLSEQKSAWALTGNGESNEASNFERVESAGGYEREF